MVRRWDDNSDLMKFGTRALIHGLLDVIVDGYFEAIEALDDDVEEIEDELFDERPEGVNADCSGARSHCASRWSQRVGRSCRCARSSTR